MKGPDKIDLSESRGSQTHTSIVSEFVAHCTHGTHLNAIEQVILFS